MPPSLTFITFGPEIHTGRVVLVFMVLPCSYHAILRHCSFAHTVPSDWTTLPSLLPALLRILHYFSGHSPPDTFPDNSS